MHLLGWEECISSNLHWPRSQYYFGQDIPCLSLNLEVNNRVSPCGANVHNCNWNSQITRLGHKSAKGYCKIDPVFGTQPVSWEDEETAANDEQSVGLLHLPSDRLHPRFGNVVPKEDNVGLQNPCVTLWTAGYPANNLFLSLYSIVQQLMYHKIKSIHNPSFNLNISTICSGNSTSPSGLSSSHGHPLRSSLIRGGYFAYQK